MEKTISRSCSYYATYQYSTVSKYEDGGKMHGARRVLAFCFLTAVLPTSLIILPLYLRHIKYADVMYKVSESDVIQIHDGQSSIFCEKHSLEMNTTFHAFQMKGTPEISNSRKHIRLKKSMSLPDDTVEYWGFYLLKGATVELKACSRYEGSKILVVKGDKILNTCGILDNHNNKIDPLLAVNQGRVIVTLEGPAELVDTENHPKFVKSKVIDVEETKNNAAEETSEEIDDSNNLAHFQKLAKDQIGNNVNVHHIKFRFENKPFLNVNQTKNKSSISSEQEVNNPVSHKVKRDTAHYPHTLLDRGVNHGGNAFNYTSKVTEASVSSFENSLLECYDGNILISNPFPSGEICQSVHYLERTTTLKITHDVLVDGYYYYIFYSDNDFVLNDIHAIFDIFKPTFEYANLSDSKVCINKTECSFPVTFLSNELVIVEVPTKDGIEHEGEDSSILKSRCHPRMSVYVIFPISVLVLILLCAFL